MNCFTQQPSRPLPAPEPPPSSSEPSFNPKSIINHLAAELTHSTSNHLYSVETLTDITHLPLQQHNSDTSHFETPTLCDNCCCRRPTRYANSVPPRMSSLLQFSLSPSREIIMLVLIPSKTNLTFVTFFVNINCELLSS